MGSVTVAPGSPGSTHEISIDDGVSIYGLKLSGGAKGIQEVPATPSTLYFTQGGTKYGNAEPGFSHVEQRDWSGGRGQDDFSVDVTQFFDSKEAWTVTPGFFTCAPLMNFGATGVTMDIGGLSYAELPST